MVGNRANIYVEAEMTKDKKEELIGDTSKQHGVVYGRERKPLTQEMLKTIGIGKIYWDKDIGHIQDPDARDILEKYIARAEHMVKSGTGLWIGGPIGAGKTTAAVVIAKEVRRWGFSVFFTTVDKCKENKTNINDYDEVAKSFYKRLETTDLLIIDNLDDDFVTDKWFGPKHLEKILRERNANKMPTIITSSIQGWTKKKEMELILECVKESMAMMAVVGENLRDKPKDEIQSLISKKKDD